MTDLHPADIADLFEALGEHEKRKLFRELDMEPAVSSGPFVTIANDM